MLILAKLRLKNSSFEKCFKIFKKVTKQPQNPLFLDNRRQLQNFRKTIECKQLNNGNKSDGSIAQFSKYSFPNARGTVF